MSRKRKQSHGVRWSSCTVLQTEGANRRGWRFALGSSQASLQSELDADTLASSSFQRTWRHLFKPHLNLAWMPSEVVWLLGLVFRQRRNRLRGI